MKFGLKMKFEKGKEKKRKQPGSFSAQAAQPASRASPPLPLLFFFFTEPLMLRPHLSALPLPSPRPLSFPLHGGAAADPAAPARIPLLPLAIKAVNQAPEHQGLVTPPLILISFP
jgi:hypothetical protein